MEPVPIRLIKDRRYELVPVDQIEVLNSRNREEEQFSENVRSIKDVGLQKPVVVNERFFPTTGKYELVRREGRLIAHQRLEKLEIPAEIIDCDRKEAYLISLVENIARVPPATMWFLRGVEKGIFPLGLAIRIAESDEEGMQEIMMDAFDGGLMTMNNLRVVRTIIKDRLNDLKSKKSSKQVATSEEKPPSYTVKELREDISQAVRDGESFVREAKTKEGRLVCLLEGLSVLRASEEFMNLLRAEGLAEMPSLRFLDRKRKEPE